MVALVRMSVAMMSFVVCSDRRKFPPPARGQVWEGVKAATSLVAFNVGGSCATGDSVVL